MCIVIDIFFFCILYEFCFLLVTDSVCAITGNEKILSSSAAAVKVWLPSTMGSKISFVLWALKMTQGIKSAAVCSIFVILGSFCY